MLGSLLIIAAFILLWVGLKKFNKTPRIVPIGIIVLLLALYGFYFVDISIQDMGNKFAIFLAMIGISLLLKDKGVI